MVCKKKSFWQRFTCKECDNPGDKKEVFYEVISQIVGEVRFKCRFCDYKRFLNFSRKLNILLMGSINNQFQNYRN